MPRSSRPCIEPRGGLTRPLATHDRRAMSTRRRDACSEALSDRRAFLRRSGKAAVSLAAGAARAACATSGEQEPDRQAATAKPVSTCASAAGLSALAFENPEFDGQLLRALDTIPWRGAAVGECFVTARAIPAGDTQATLGQSSRGHAGDPARLARLGRSAPGQSGQKNEKPQTVNHGSQSGAEGQTVNHGSQSRAGGWRQVEGQTVNHGSQSGPSATVRFSTRRARSAARSARPSFRQPCSVNPERLRERAQFSEERFALGLGQLHGERKTNRLGRWGWSSRFRPGKKQTRCLRPGHWPHASAVPR